MKKFTVYILLTTALCADGWKYESTAGGVVAYTRVVPNSSFKEYKVETEVDATLTQIVAVLVDVRNLPQWVDRCVEAAILKEFSPTESITRTVTASPFPLKNREAIAHGRLTQNATSRVVVLESKGRFDYLPLNPAYERVHSVRGRWVLTPKPHGKVHIQMIGHTDPGGVIPGPIANQFVVLIPLNSIKNLRNQIKKEKYAQAKLSYIRD